MKLRVIIIGAIGCVLLGILAVAWFSDTGLNRAPNVELTLLNGERFKFQHLHGRPVMVTFWATTCVGCQREVPHLIELYNEFGPKGFEVVAVAMAYDPPTQVYEFLKRRQIPYKIALDLDSGVADAFGDVRLTPTTFLIAADGRIVYQVLGEFDAQRVHRLVEELLQDQSNV